MSGAPPITAARRAAAVHWKEADRIHKKVVTLADEWNRTQNKIYFVQWQAAVANYKAECDKAKAIDPFWRETATEDYPS